MTIHNTHSQSGSTTIGFIFGLCAGLAIAAVIAFVMLRSPMPFVDKASNPIPSTAVTNQPNHDLNRSLAGNEPTVAPAAPPMDMSVGDGDKPETTNDTIPNSEAKKEDLTKKDDAAKKEDIKKAEELKKETATKPNQKVYLQAGAFSNVDDAEQQKAKLAMSGVSSQIVTSEVNGKTLHRVRVGPFNEVDQAKQERKKLSNNQIEATVVTTP